MVELYDDPTDDNDQDKDDSVIVELKPSRKVSCNPRVPIFSINAFLNSFSRTLFNLIYSLIPEKNTLFLQRRFMK